MTALVESRLLVVIQMMDGRHAHDRTRRFRQATDPVFLKPSQEEVRSLLKGRKTLLREIQEGFGLIEDDSPRLRKTRQESLDEPARTSPSINYQEIMLSWKRDQFQNFLVNLGVVRMDMFSRYIIPGSEIQNVPTVRLHEARFSSG